MVTGRVTDASLVVGPADRPLRLGPRRPRRAGRRHRRRAHPRVRRAGDRRQLQLLHRTARRRPAAGLPDRRGARRRVARHHQAPGHRRRGHRRDRHRAAAVRDRRARLPRPGRGRPTSTRSTLDAGRAGPGRGHRRPGQPAAGHAQGRRQHARRLPQRDDVRPLWTRHRGQGGAGPRRSSSDAVGKDGLEFALARTDHPDAADTEAASALLHVHLQDADPRAGRPGVLGRRGGAGAGLLPGLHADHAARRRDPVRRLHRRHRRRRTRSRTPPCCPTASASRSPRPPTAADLGRVAGHTGRPRTTSAKIDGPTRRGAARARSSAPAPATRAATPTSASGPAPTPAYAWLRGCLTVDAAARAAARRPRRSPSSGTSCRTCGRVNFVVHGLLGGASPRRPGSTRRPRRSASGCAPGSSTSRMTLAVTPPSAGSCASWSATSSTREVVPHLADWERAGEVPRELHRTAAEARPARHRLPRGGRRQRRRPARLARGHRGADPGRRLVRPDRRAVHPRHRAAAHRRVRRRRPDRPVRPADAAGEKIGSLAVTEPDGGSDVAAHPHHRPPRRRPTTWSTAPRPTSPAASGPTSSRRRCAPAGRARRASRCW